MKKTVAEVVNTAAAMEDGGEVALEFMQDNTFTELHYTTLQYKNEDYLAPAKMRRSPVNLRPVRPAA